MRDKVTRKDDGYGRYRVSPKMAIFIFVVIILVAAALVWQTKVVLLLNTTNTGSPELGIVLFLRSLWYFVSFILVAYHL